MSNDVLTCAMIRIEEEIRKKNFGETASFLRFNESVTDVAILSATASEIELTTQPKRIRFGTDQVVAWNYTVASAKRKGMESLDRPPRSCDRRDDAHQSKSGRLAYFLHRAWGCRLIGNR